MTKKNMMKELHRTCQLKEISIIKKFTELPSLEECKLLNAQLDIITWVIDEIEEYLA